MKKLEGKVALITGVGRRKGIGYAICEALAQEGADIFYTYWNKYDVALGLEGSDEDPATFASQWRGYGVRVASASVDLQEVDAAEMLFALVLKELGTPSVLVNNACVSTSQSFEEVTAELLDAHYKVNVRATTLLCREFAKHAHEGGKIVCLTSGQSLGVMENELPYTVTKAAVDMLTMQLSPLLSAKGITINAIDPGPTDTGWMSGEVKEKIRTESSLKKVSLPQDAAALVLSYICGDREAETGMVLHAER